MSRPAKEEDPNASCVLAKHLDINYQTLVDNIQVMSTLLLLKMGGVLSQQEESEILQKKSMTDRAACLVDIVKQKSTTDIQIFINTLNKTNQTELGSLLQSQNEAGEDSTESVSFPIPIQVEECMPSNDTASGPNRLTQAMELERSGPQESEDPTAILEFCSTVEADKKY